jgi:adenine phosphoribosyltransferase
MNLKNYIAAVKDFPKKGILFRDITPLLKDKNALKNTIDKMCLFAKDNNTTVVCGPEARGFIFGTPVAYSLGVGFVPIRKPGKLPRKSVSHKYELEYGENILSVHHDAFKKGDKVLIEWTGQGPPRKGACQASAQRGDLRVDWLSDQLGASQVGRLVIE